jgi:anti-sigma regulatory factor (Ser/Thr protein kinase)
MAEREFSIPAYHVNIEKICDAAGEAAEEAGFNDKTAYACQLAVGEACENVINHGYKEEGNGQIVLITRASPGSLILELSDTAPPFNPAVSPDNSGWEHEDPPIGGLGLLIIHRVMDKVTYRREGDRNYLELHKNMPVR